MRVTDRMMINHTLDSLRSGRDRLGELQKQVATGRRLLKSSDDPGDVERALTLTSELRIIENQSRNLDTSRDWLSGTDQALSDFSDLVLSLRNLSLTALNETNSDAELEAMAAQVGEHLENALSVANSRQAGYYLFSGHQTRTAPFVRQGNAVIYQGDNEEIRHAVELGQTMPVNVTGVTGENGGLLNALNQMADLQIAMQDGNRISINDFLEASDLMREDLSSAQGLVGSRIQRINQTQSRLSQREIDLKQLYSSLVDADMAEAVTEMNAQTRAYELTMAASARFLPRSLLDFLR